MGDVIPFVRPKPKALPARVPAFYEVPDTPYAMGFARCRDLVLDLLHSWIMAEHVDRALLSSLQTSVGEIKP